MPLGNEKGLSAVRARREKARSSRTTAVSLRFRKGPRRERSAVLPGDPFENFASDAHGAERRKAKEELANTDAMT